mgnify:CR=1 FL=1
MSPQTVAELFALDTLVDDEERGVHVRQRLHRRLAPQVALAHTLAHVLGALLCATLGFALARLVLRA